MRAVFVHRHFPGQFGHLLERLSTEGWDTVFVCERAEARPPNVRLVRYLAERRGAGRAHRHLSMTEQHLRTGEQVAAVLETLRQREGPPAVVFGHIGWGGLMFAKDVLPSTPMLGYCEFFYRADGSDVGFDPDETVTLEDRIRLRMRNTAQLLTLEAIEAGVSPTRWQQQQYPADLRRRIAVAHDGIDVATCRPDPAARLVLPDGRAIAHGDPVVTYVARDLEPYRGFPQFMRAAAKVAARHPEALFVVVGGDGVTYGRRRPDGRSWRQVMLEETGIDPKRIVFLGRIPHRALIRLMQISAVHVYLTYPFVLSWSFLEAMACGALVVGSATPPVEEVLVHGVNGLLAGFFDTDALADAVLEGLGRQEELKPLRRAARQTVMRSYALEQCLDRQLRLLDWVRGRATVRQSNQTRSALVRKSSHLSVE